MQSFDPTFVQNHPRMMQIQSLCVILYINLLSMAVSRTLTPLTITMSEGVSVENMFSSSLFIVASLHRQCIHNTHTETFYTSGL